MPNLPIEEIIQQAIEEGKFDNLPGQGKPLQLDTNPHEDPSWRAAHHILKSSGFTLPWIESLREIETNLQEAVSGLERTWEWYQSENDQKTETEHPVSEWNDAVETFREQIATINNEIRSYNLEVPNERFQLQLINVDNEINRIIGFLE